MQWRSETLISLLSAMPTQKDFKNLQFQSGHTRHIIHFRLVYTFDTLNSYQAHNKHILDK